MLQDTGENTGDKEFLVKHTLIPKTLNKLILLCMDYKVALRLEKIESQK